MKNMESRAKSLVSLSGYREPLISIPKTSLIGREPTLENFWNKTKNQNGPSILFLQGVFRWNMNERTLFRQFAVHFVFVPFSYQDLYVTSIIQMPHAKYQMCPLSDFCHEIQNKYKHEGHTLDSGNNVVTKSQNKLLTNISRETLCCIWIVGAAFEDL